MVLYKLFAKQSITQCLHTCNHLGANTSQYKIINSYICFKHKPLKPIYKPILLLLVVVLALAACRRDDGYASWETNILTPIASTSLTLDKLIRDSSLRRRDDSSLQLVFTENLYTARAEDFFIVPDTEIKATLTLEKLQLSDRALSQSITLEKAYPQAALLNGQTLLIPAQNITGIGAAPIDASSFFQTAELKEGFIDIGIDNGFPTEIEEVVFLLVNKVTGNTLVSDKITDIPPGTSKSITASLAGKRVDASLEVQIQSLKTYATPNPVKINKNDKVTININVRGLKPKSATAIFPSQSVYTKDENALYNFNGAQMKKLRIKSGILRLRIVSTIEEHMTVDYKIPHATLNGNSVHEILQVNPAPPGRSTDVLKDIPLAGYTIDLRGKDPMVDDTVNAFWNLLDVTIDSSGIQRSISLNDSIYIYYGLLDMVAEYAEGYFGQQTLKAEPGIVAFDFFKNTIGSIDFEDMNLALKISNGIGASARMNIQSITSKNTRTGNNVLLNFAPLSSPIIMPAATDNPFTIKTNTYLLNKSNSNIKPFILNLPNEVEYKMDVTTNPNGNVSNWHDFIYDKSELKVDLEFSMPLSLVADNLVLSDTLPFDMFASGQLNRVKEGTLNIVTDNSFPFSAALQLYLINDAGVITDSVMTVPYTTIQAATVDVNTGLVITPTRSVLKAYFNRERMDMVKKTHRLLVKAIFNTPKGLTNPVKIYSNYKFDVKLTGDFVYEQRY